jgi:alkylated DNA repair dioxygenase AlkB
VTDLRYNGKESDPPETFPPAMEEACAIIENIVNEQMERRSHKYPLEFAGQGVNKSWRANVAASNCYAGSKESVGPHSDQLTQLGPYPTIASLSLGEIVHLISSSCDRSNSHRDSTTIQLARGNPNRRSVCS